MKSKIRLVRYLVLFDLVKSKTLISFLVKLNGLWFDSYKLRCHLALFSKLNSRVLR